MPLEREQLVFPTPRAQGESHEVSKMRLSCGRPGRENQRRRLAS
ncbi:hypothetical protein BURPS305_3191 [Burkholderia pseudomallei 305]|nr:hypothetical protein BURPS305_3191 [Burkholderia pseudomallei 305]